MNTSDVLSIVAITISVIVFFKDIFIFKKKLFLKISEINIPNVSPNEDSDYYTMTIYCSIENRNQFPITITNANIGKLQACNVSFSLLGDSYHAYGQEPSYEVSSIKIPFPIDGFKSTGATAITFLSKEPINIQKIDFLEIHTTRGKVNVKISNFLKQNLK